MLGAWVAGCSRRRRPVCQRAADCRNACLFRPASLYCSTSVQLLNMRRHVTRPDTCAACAALCGRAHTQQRPQRRSARQRHGRHLRRPGSCRSGCTRCGAVFIMPAHQLSIAARRRERRALCKMPSRLSARSRRPLRYPAGRCRAACAQVCLHARSVLLPPVPAPLVLACLPNCPRVNPARSTSRWRRSERPRRAPRWSGRWCRSSWRPSSGG